MQKPSRERRRRPLGVRQFRQKLLAVEPRFAEGCLEIRVLAIAPRQAGDQFFAPNPQIEIDAH